MRKQVARDTSSFIRTVILATGDSCSGKTTIIQALTHDTGIKNINMDSFLLNWGTKLSLSSEIRQIGQIVDQEYSQTFVEEFIPTLEFPERVIFLEGHILRYKKVYDQLVHRLKKEGYRVWKLSRA